MIQGGTPCTKDIPPYVMVGRNPGSYVGINIVRLRRENFSAEDIEAIHNTYRMIYQSDLNVSQAMAKLREDKLSENPQVQYIMSFIEKASRGIIRDWLLEMTLFEI